MLAPNIQYARDFSSLTEIERLNILQSLGIQGTRNGDWYNFVPPPQIRETATPTENAGVNLTTGQYHDFGIDENLRWWDFVAAVGGYHDWMAARDHHMGYHRDRPASRTQPTRTPAGKKPEQKKAKQKSKISAGYWGDIAAAQYERPEAETARRHLAADWQMPVGILTRLRIGAACDPQMGWTGDAGDAWTWPERDGSGQVVGIGKRTADHAAKLCMSGSTRGIIADPRMDIPAGGILHIAEGLSDTAALMAMGLSAIGRPSLAGAESHRMLATYIREHIDRSVRIVYLADSDDEQKQHKAREAAGELAKAIGRPVTFARLAGGEKDAREWREQYLDRHPDASARVVADACLDSMTATELTGNESIGPDGMHKPECGCHSCEDRAWEYERCNFYSTLAHKFLGKKPITVRQKCGKWGCLHCRDTILLPKWRDHLEGLFGDIYRKRRSLYYRFCALDEAEKILLDRENASRRDKSRRYSFVLVIDRRNQCVLIASKEFQKSEKSESLNEVMHALDTQLREIELFGVRPKGKRGRVIRRSDDWALPNAEKSDWTKISDTMDPTSDSVLHVAKMIGIRIDYKDLVEKKGKTGIVARYRLAGVTTAAMTIAQMRLLAIWSAELDAVRCNTNSAPGSKDCTGHRSAADRAKPPARPPDIPDTAPI